MCVVWLKLQHGDNIWHCLGTNSYKLLPMHVASFCRQIFPGNLRIISFVSNRRKTFVDWNGNKML